MIHFEKLESLGVIDPYRQGIALEEQTIMLLGMAQELVACPIWKISLTQPVRRLDGIHGFTSFGYKTSAAMTNNGPFEEAC